MFHLSIEYPDAGARNSRRFSQVPGDTVPDMATALAWVASPPEWVSRSIKKGYLLTARKGSLGGPAILCSRVLKTYRRRGPFLIVVNDHRITSVGGSGGPREATESAFGARKPSAFMGSNYSAYDRSEWGHTWKAAWSTNHRVVMMMGLALSVKIDLTSIREALVDVVEFWLKNLGSDAATRTFSPYVEAMRAYAEGSIDEHAMARAISGSRSLPCDETEDGYGACLLAKDAVGAACG